MSSSRSWEYTGNFQFKNASRSHKNPIGTTWVDVNNRDEIHPDYRSKLVAQELKRDKREDMFAATPPLEAKKLLFSMAMTEGLGWGSGWFSKLDFIDVRKTYLHAKARRYVYVKLSMEDHE